MASVLRKLPIPTRELDRGTLTLLGLGRAASVLGDGDPGPSCCSGVANSSGVGSPAELPVVGADGGVETFDGVAERDGSHVVCVLVEERA